VSAEDRWANQREWETERGEIEIKWRSKDMGPSPAVLCDYPKCEKNSRRTYCVGRVTSHGGPCFDVCVEHDSDECAYHLYQKLQESRGWN
jgi:hypothetical protein